MEMLDSEQKEAMTGKPASIKRKLMTAIMGTSIAVLVLTCAVFLTTEYVASGKSLARTMITRAGIIAASSSAAMALQNDSDAADVLRALHIDPHIVAACLYDKDGHIFARYPANAPDKIFPSSPEKNGQRFENGHFSVFKPIVQENQWLGTVYLKTDLSELNEKFQLYAVVLSAIAVISFFVSYGLSTRFQKSISEPIRDLAETTRSVSIHRDYAVRAQKLSNDEIGLLVDSFNDMLGQIEQRDASLRSSK